MPDFPLASVYARYLLHSRLHGLNSRSERSEEKFLTSSGIKPHFLSLQTLSYTKPRGLYFLLTSSLFCY
jgi:hypothetical protein